MPLKIRDWLIAARKDKNLTQQEVAEKLGVTRISYSRYENGERTPRPSTAKKIESLLGVNKEYFFWNP